MEIISTHQIKTAKFGFEKSKVVVSDLKNMELPNLQKSKYIVQQIKGLKERG